MIRSVVMMLTAWCMVGLSGAIADEKPPAPPNATLEKAFADKVQPFLKQHCLSCHGAEKAKGGVRFDRPMPDLVDPKVGETWIAVKRMIAQGDMPPEGKPRPAADEMIPVLEWIDAANSRAAAVTRGGIGRRSLRRLTRQEYVNTFQDVLGLSFPHSTIDLTSRLPSDAIGNSFSNDSNLQVTQTLLVRRGLDLAEDLLAVALPDESAVQPLKHQVDMRLIAESALNAFSTKSDAEKAKLRGPAIHNFTVPSLLEKGESAKLSVRGDLGLSFSIHRDHLDPSRGLMLEPNPILIGVNKNTVIVTLPFVPERGVLRLRAKAAALKERDDSLPTLRLSLGGYQAPGNVTYPVAEVLVAAAAPREYVLEVPLALVPCDWSLYRREKTLYVQIDNGAALLGPTLAPENYDQKKRESYLKRNRLLLESFSLEIEPTPTWPNSSEALLLARAESEDEASWARRSLGSFLARAFRRPATAAELDFFSRAFQKERDAGSSFRAAYRMVAAAALVSPQSLYLVEPRTTERRPLSSWELASRLSYLFLATAPDAELLARARDNSLLADDELRRQVERLLKDDRAATMSREFVSQWLDLDVIAHLEPRVLRYGRIIDNDGDKSWYERAIRRDLATEPAEYLLDLFRGDRPVQELVASEHVVVNDRLARFYEIPGIAGPQWRRVPAPANRRGGLLTQAGCIAAATHAQERGEIKRGVYIARRFFGIDIPSPPGNVDIKPLDVQLTEDKQLRNLTVEQHMRQHRSIPTCAVCHLRSDPLAFVWDEFDMFGLRKRDRIGNPVPFHVRGSAPDRAAFDNFDEFRESLLRGGAESAFAKAFSERLYAYVLGRGLDHGDLANLTTLRAAAARDGGGVRSLVTAMVLSEPFRHK